MSDSKAVSEFRRAHGRAPSLLITGNVANNAYLIAYHLRSVGWDADVLCADYYHSMGCPEWEHAVFDASAIDEFAPDWSQVHADGYVRPRWFAQGPRDQAVEYLQARRAGKGSEAKWDRLRNPAPSAAADARAAGPRSRVDRAWHFVRTYKQTPQRVALVGQIALQRVQHALPGLAARPWIFHRRAARLRALMSRYDAVEACGSEVAWAGMTGRPFVAFEHGTIRWAAQRGDVMQSLTMDGFARCAAVMVTNGDSIPLAERHHFPAVTATVHPLVEVDPALAGPAEAEAENVLAAARINAGPLLLCPLRHDWDVKGTDLYLRALPGLRERVGDDVTLLLTAWGNDIQRSKDLVADLGAEDLVRWIPPQGRQVLLCLMTSSLVVLDQTALPHFGSTAPQALSLGVPVMSSYDPASTARICAEPAPILPVFTPGDVVEGVVRLLDDGFRQALSMSAVTWCRRFHSTERVVADHEGVMSALIDPPAAQGPRTRTAEAS
ncbi:MAG: glycosyltransferase [Actinomycetota bacterium]|nr:glycosyltransferase [Actinomycetota bacterium]